MDKQPVRLEGIVTKIIFRKNEFLIGLLNTNTGVITFTGDFHGIYKGDKITVYGQWIKHIKYGNQLEVTQWERPIPSNKEQVISFLSSGLVKGVGEARAKDIAEMLGDRAVEIIKNDGAEALKGIRGIGKKTAEDIAESIQNTFEVQEIARELSNFGISTKLCMKLYKKFGSSTVKKILQNPYLIMYVDNIGFEKADSIAEQMGIHPNSAYRMNACLTYTLNLLCNIRGHSFIEEETLLKNTLQKLNHNMINKEYYIEYYELQQNLYTLEEQSVMFEGTKVYPKKLYTYEEYIAQKLSILRGSRGGEAMPKIEKSIKEYQKKNRIILAERQREAVIKLLEENILVLTGKPGTGKTTTLKAMIDIYKEMNPKSIIRLSAPTGRASRKMYESTGHKAMTVHRMLGYKQGEIPDYNEDNKLKADLVVVDEWSMADLRLTYWLLSALERNTKVVFIGDVDQLPSVSPGNVLNDFISSGLPTVRLNEIFRQAEDSQIIKNAHRINEGKNILIDNSKDDFYFIKQNNTQKIANIIIRSALRFIELGYSLEDILILSPMKDGDAGVEKLNEMLRESINPKSPLKNEIKIGNRFFREGDKVMQNVNNKENDVNNGELGIIKSISLKNKKQSKDEVICNFDGKDILYKKEDLKELELGYALTIHKSQGGEAPIVIMPITMAHRVMLARNLYYTGVTRAKEKVVLIGTEEAMNTAINNDKIAKRNSLLDKRIIKHIEHIERLNAQ